MPIRERTVNQPRTLRVVPRSLTAPRLISWPDERDTNKGGTGEPAMLDGRTPVLSDDPRIRARTDQVRAIAVSLLGPKLLMMPGGRLAQNGMGTEDLARQGYRPLVDRAMPLMVTGRSPRQHHAAVQVGQPEPLTGGDTKGEQDTLCQTIDLEPSLPIDRQTVDH